MELFPLTPGTSSVAKLWRHLRDGTLIERLHRAAGRVPAHVRVRWQGAASEREAAAALSRWAQIFAQERPPGWVLCLGEGGKLHRRLEQALRRRRVAHRSLSLAELPEFDARDADGLRGIICGYAEALPMTRAVLELARHPALSGVPFEYASGITPERTLFARRDEYAHTWFVAPCLLDRPSPYELYEESLRHFEQKCGLRDYLDLYQVLRYVVANHVPGDVAEFGSYRGHSGWLIARTLQALGADKRVHLFDTFDVFPPEPYGMDHFWNRSHFVDLAEVERKLSGFANVQLIKGDFTRTLASSGVRQLALAYVDCDSYRATRFLIDALWERHLAPGAALVCEDYGHPALLGNRVAVHEELDRRSGVFRLFSQFSGLYVALKLPSS